MDTFKRKKCKYCGAIWRQNTSISFTFPHCEGERQARIKDHLKKHGHHVEKDETIIGVDPANGVDKTAICIQNGQGIVRVITM